MAYHVVRAWARALGEWVGTHMRMGGESRAASDAYHYGTGLLLSINGVAMKDASAAQLQAALSNKSDIQVDLAVTVNQPRARIDPQRDDLIINEVLNLVRWNTPTPTHHVEQRLSYLTQMGLITIQDRYSQRSNDDNDNESISLKIDEIIKAIIGIAKSYLAGIGRLGVNFDSIEKTGELLRAELKRQTRDGSHMHSFRMQVNIPGRIAIALVKIESDADLEQKVASYGGAVGPLDATVGSGTAPTKYRFSSFTSGIIVVDQQAFYEDLIHLDEIDKGITTVMANDLVRSSPEDQYQELQKVKAAWNKRKNAAIQTANQ